MNTYVLSPCALARARPKNWRFDQICLTSVDKSIGLTRLFTVSQLPGDMGTVMSRPLAKSWGPRESIISSGARASEW